MKRHLFCVTLLLALATSAFGQQRATTSSLPKVETIIASVERNVEALRNSLQDFLCDERVRSQIVVDGEVKHEVRAESAIRAARTNEIPAFAESREWKTADGKTSAQLDEPLPFQLRGGFTDAIFLIFTPDAVRCFDFTLSGTEQLRGAKALVLTASTKQDAATLGGECATRTPGRKGRIWIDAATMQVLRIESPKRPSAQGEIEGWTEEFTIGWTVDYERVTIDGRPYWMPSQITAEAVSTEKPRLVNYQAEYSNYRKFVMSSRVVDLKVVGSGRDSSLRSE